MEEFCATDFFLFLFGSLTKAESENGFNLFDWRPWSILYMKQIPEFIKNAEKTQYAQQITEVFNVPNINELKKRLKERYPTVHKLFTGGFWHVPNLDVAIDKIATK